MKMEKMQFVCLVHFHHSHWRYVIPIVIVWMCMCIVASQIKLENIKKFSTVCSGYACSMCRNECEIVENCRWGGKWERQRAEVEIKLELFLGQRECQQNFVNCKGWRFIMELMVFRELLLFYMLIFWHFKAT